MTNIVTETKESGQTEGEKTEAKKTENGTGTDGDIKATTGETQSSQATEGDETKPKAGAEKTLTQAEVDKIVGATRAKARDGAVASLLEELKVEDTDALTKLVADAEEKRQANLSEVEKLTEQIAQLVAAGKDSKQTSKTLKAYEESVAATVVAQIKSLSIPAHIAALLEPMSALEQLSYLSENSKHFTTPAKSTNTNAGDKGGSATATTAEQAKKNVQMKYGIR